MHEPIYSLDDFLYAVQISTGGVFSLIQDLVSSEEVVPMVPLL